MAHPQGCGAQPWAGIRERFQRLTASQKVVCAVRPSLTAGSAAKPHTCAPPGREHLYRLIQGWRPDFIGTYPWLLSSAPSALGWGNATLGWHLRTLSALTTCVHSEGELTAQLDCAAAEVARAVVVKERTCYIGKRKRNCADPKLVRAIEVVLVHKER